MRALVTYPRRPGSVELIDIPEPRLEPGHVLIAVQEVGTDGTDREVIAAEHGGPPPAGGDYLVLGHESLGRVAAVGEGVEGLAEGDYVVATVRRPDGCPNCQRGESDMCLWGGYVERGIKGAHGYLTDLVVERPEFLVPLPAHLREVGALLEPLSIDVKAIEQAWRIQQRMFWEPQVALIFGMGAVGILAAMMLRARGLRVWVYSRGPADDARVRLAREVGVDYISADEVPTVAEAVAHVGRVDFMLEATGSAGVAAQAMQLLEPNAVLCLLSVTGGSEPLELDVAALNQRLVLGNGLIFGSVNSNPGHFRRAIVELEAFEQRWPGVARRLITRRVPLERYQEALERRDGDLKVVFEVAGES